jgi:hypothetical protein
LISSAYAGTGLGRRSSIRPKIFWNNLLGTATSTNWNETYRPWLTTCAPVEEIPKLGRALARAVIGAQICAGG